MDKKTRTKNTLKKTGDTQKKRPVLLVRAIPPFYKPIKRHPIKRAEPHSTVYTPRPGSNPIKPAKPPKKRRTYRRLFFLRPITPMPKSPYRHKYKKERHIDGVTVLLVALALITAVAAGWLVASLL